MRNSGIQAGVTRHLRSDRGGNVLHVCLRKLLAGSEVFGGLGDALELTFGHISQYVSPIFSNSQEDDARFAPDFDLTPMTMEAVYRLGFSYEFTGIVFFAAQIKHRTLVRQRSTTIRALFRQYKLGVARAMR